MRLIDADKLFLDRLEFRNPKHKKNGEFNKGWNDCVNIFCDIINEQPTVNEWIPVSEPPETTRHCIVADGSIISNYAYYLAPKRTFYRIGSGSSITGGELLDKDIIEPTYWREMPDVPKDSILEECCG